MKEVEILAVLEAAWWVAEGMAGEELFLTDEEVGVDVFLNMEEVEDTLEAFLITEVFETEDAVCALVEEQEVEVLLLLS